MRQVKKRKLEGDVVKEVVLAVPNKKSGGEGQLVQKKHLKFVDSGKFRARMSTDQFIDCCLISVKMVLIVMKCTKAYETLLKETLNSPSAI